jgi:hypothetical protein
MEPLEPYRFDSPLGRVKRDPKPTDFPASVLLGDRRIVFLLRQSAELSEYEGVENP